MAVKPKFDQKASVAVSSSGKTEVVAHGGKPVLLLGRSAAVREPHNGQSKLQ